METNIICWCIWHKSHRMLCWPWRKAYFRRRRYIFLKTIVCAFLAVEIAEVPALKQLTQWQTELASQLDCSLKVFVPVNWLHSDKHELLGRINILCCCCGIYMTVNYWAKKPEIARCLLREAQRADVTIVPCCSRGEAGWCSSLCVKAIKRNKTIRKLVCLFVLITA